MNLNDSSFNRVEIVARLMHGLWNPAGRYVYLECRNGYT